MNGKFLITEVIIGKCEFCCCNCPAYKGNIKSENDKEATSKGWSSYHRVQVNPEDVSCEGCFENHHSKMDTHCRINPCATTKGYETCAEYRYLCHDLKGKAERYEEILLHFNSIIPTKDYLKFVKPYEGKIILDAIRSRLYLAIQKHNRPIAYFTVFFKEPREVFLFSIRN